MKHPRHAITAAVLTLLVAWLGACSTAAAQTIRVVVPTPAGAAADVMARVLAEHMGRSLRQTMVIDNKPGASGVVAMESVLNADPSATVLLVAGLDHVIYGPAALGRRAWSPLDDVVPIGFVNSDRWVIVGNPESAGDWKTMVQTSRHRPLRCANAGLGTTQHAVCAWFAKRVGLEMEHIPYSQPFMPDLIGGRVDIAAMPVPGAAVSLKSGRIKGVALLSKARHPAFLDVPASPELNRPDLVFEAGLAIYARVGTPQSAVDQLHAALLEAQSDESVKKLYSELGVDTVTTTLREVRALLKERIALNDSIRTEAFGKAR
jgi:tripartite-type tricarboxylate transporter receptor subunit TctC